MFGKLVRLVGLFVLLQFTVLSSTLFANESTIHIGPGGTSGCATGGCYLHNNEVNGFGSSLDLYMTSGGTPTLDSPIWLIFAVPNGGTLTSNSVTSAVLNDVNNSYLPTPITFNFLGLMGTMGPGQEVYGQLGKKINGSPSFTNYAAWDLAVNNLTVSSFNLYVFTLTTKDFDAKDFINLNLNGIPTGTFAVGWGEVTTVDKHGKITVKQIGTPFTEAGLENHKIPEPGTVAMFGSGLLGAAVLLRRKLK